jgi:hypothetical protein
MTGPRFGDRVRIAIAPETEARGFAGRAGEVWGESVPSVSGVGPVIGDRGEDLALSVFFEETEDQAWFAPHLVQGVDRVASRSRLLPLVLFAAFALLAATAIAGVGRSRVRRLTVVSASTPCFPVQGYLTAGAYPNVRGGSKAAARTNIALRRAVVTDQRRYAPSAIRHTVPNAVGTYETAIDQGLISASTVVVSALIPALRLYPGGNDGQTWISATVEVRSGRAVSLRELLASPPLALPGLVRDWKARLRGSMLWRYVAEDPARYTPTLAHYRHFALTPTGLAFGFPQEPAGSRFAAVIPYRLVHPYLSPLGRRLVAGVRRPRPTRNQRQRELAWTSPHGTLPGVARNWPLTCT